MTQETSRRDKMIADITPAEIQSYISSNGWRPATMRSYLGDVRTLLAFALKRKYIRENPAAAVDLPKVEDNPPGIVTPKEARAEAEQLEWSEIFDEFVEMKAHKAKTRQRRPRG